MIFLHDSEHAKVSLNRIGEMGTSCGRGMVLQHDFNPYTRLICWPSYLSAIRNALLVSESPKNCTEISFFLSFFKISVQLKYFCSTFFVLGNNLFFLFFLNCI